MTVFDYTYDTSIENRKQYRREFQQQEAQYEGLECFQGNNFTIFVDREYTNNRRESYIRTQLTRSPDSNSIKIPTSAKHIVIKNITFAKEDGHSKAYIFMDNKKKEDEIGLAKMDLRQVNLEKVKFLKIQDKLQKQLFAFQVKHQSQKEGSNEVKNIF